MNYIKSPTLYNTGILPDTTAFRMKQGLLPQNIANNCLSNPAKQTCNRCSLYPFYTPDVNYCMGKISKNCPCTRYIYQY
jgi:hypothetical protein